MQGIKEIKALLNENKVIIWRAFFNAFLYSLALILAYNGYKEVSKGYDHIISHFVGEYLDTPELPKSVRHSIRETFHWAVLVFTLAYLVVLRLGTRGTRLSYGEHVKIAVLTGVLLNVIFIARKEALIVLNSSFPLYLIIQSVWGVVCGERIRSAISYSYEKLYWQRDKCSCYLDSALEPLLIFFQEKVENSRRLNFFAGNPSLVLAFYLLVGILAYLPSVHSIFRSDHWFFLTLARSPDTTLRDVAFFEMFGHFRFTPLRWLMFYAEDNLLGNNMVSYHLLSITVHAINGLIIFLIARIILGADIFSFLIGLLFIAFASHFDTVNWSLLFDLQVATFFYLLALLFLVRYSWLKLSITNLYVAFFLSMVPTILLESFVPGPVFILLSFLCGHYYLEDRRPQEVSRHAYLATFGVAIFYGLFLISATVLNPTAGTAQKSPLDLLNWENTFRGLYTALTFVVNMNILNNIGIFPPEVEINQLVNLYPPLFKSGMVPLKAVIFLPIFLTLFKYSSRLKSWHFTLPLILMGLSHISIICIGRTKTGVFDYIVTRSHYAYFTNAVFLIALGVIIWPPNERLKRFVAVSCLLILIVFNFKNTYLSNAKVAEAMETMNTHYYRIKQFLKKNPDAVLLLDSIPSNKENYFAMCTDKAFDIAFGNRVTKFVRKATHIYDSKSFVLNKLCSSDNGGNLLEDFTIEWVSSVSPKSLRKEIGIIGSDKAYPKISITPEGFISIYMINSRTGGLDIYSVPYPESPLRNSNWVWIVVEKYGNELCFILNGVLYEKLPLDAEHLGWQVDGIQLLGNYHKGIAESARIERLFVKVGDCKYRCGNRQIGDILLTGKAILDIFKF